MIEQGYFGRALRIVLSNLPLYLVGALVLQVVCILALGLLAGPAICGIVWVTLKHARGQEVTFQDLFRGFEVLGPSFLAGVAFILMLAAGTAALVVPGIILGGLFCFAFPFIVDRGLSFSEAMAASRRLPAGQDLLDRTLFFLLALLVGVSGIVLMLVGLLFTWPLMWAIVALAYDDMTRPPAQAARAA